MRQLVERAGLTGKVVSTSAGTGDWHVGEQADERTIAALAKRGYDGSHHRARQFESAWYGQLDIVVALDRSQDRILRSWANDARDHGKIHLLRSFDPESGGNVDVPDPYYSDDAMFDAVLGMIERSSTALFRQIEPAIRSSTR